MSHSYDPQYSTKVSFNKPIMLDMLEKRDIQKVAHWLEHGEPNKKLASAALSKMIDMQWIEALDLLWSKNWLSQKGLITIAAEEMVFKTGYDRCQDFFNSDSEKWILEKISSDVLSKAQKNALYLTILELCADMDNSHYWDLFYNENIIFKGKTSENIFSHLLPSKSPNSTFIKDCINNGEIVDKKLKDFIHHKNGIQISCYELGNLFIDDSFKNFELFFHVIENSNLIIEKHELLILATQCAIFLKSVVANYVEFKELINEDSQYVEKTLERILTALIKQGLPEKVTFTTKELEENPPVVIRNGYITLPTSIFGFGMRFEARQLPLIHNLYFNKDKITDVEIWTGVAVFTPLEKVKGYELEKTYHPPTDEQFKERVEQFAKLRNEVLGQQNA